MTKPSAKFDKRLLGTWKSDRLQTFRHWKPLPKCSPKSFRKLKALFGKLVVRWERTKVHSEYDETSLDAQPYELVASDSQSVVVRMRNHLFEEDRLYFIQFEEDRYCMTLDGGFVEWFRRVDEKS
ncbi:MAG: hypothetical protein SH850_24195 [Planctomycetaceae bacterium]|nr:hypothetical protein [Planctomycetaceae bacterium]